MFRRVSVKWVKVYKPWLLRYDYTGAVSVPVLLDTLRDGVMSQGQLKLLPQDRPFSCSDRYLEIPWRLFLAAGFRELLRWCEQRPGDMEK